MLSEYDLEALRAARAIYDRQGNYEELESILERLVEHPEVDEELAIWEELAEIRGEMLHEPDRAIEAWEEVLERAPGDERALDELEQLYFQEGRWEGAVEALVEQAELADDERDQVEMYSRAAEIAEEKLEDRDRAADLYQQVLEADPSDIQAGRALERIYRSREADEAKTALVELYIDRAEVFSDRPQDRLEALRSAAGVFENELDQPDSALVALVSAFGPETADDEALRMDIERLAGETGLWEEAVEAWEETVRELGETPLAADLREELGGWVAEELDRPDDAIYHYRRALDIDPDRDELLEKLEDLLRELESWPELANVVEERIELTADPDEEIDLWRTLGEIYELRLDEPEEALDAYRQILEVDPSDLLALERLERIYESEERWEDLIRVLEQKVDATYDPDEVVDINARIAEVYEEELDQFDRAVEAWEDLLDVDQDLPMDRLVLDVDPENERALESLEELYLESEQWDRLLDVCQRQLSATHDPEEQEEIHGKIASVYEDRLGEIERAIDAYDEILVVDPESEFALRNLERLYDRVDAPFDLVDTLQQHVEVTDDPDRKVELLNRVAEVQREEIDDPYAAIEALEESLSIDGDQPASLLALAELHEQTNNWERAVEAYEELLDRLDEPDDRLDVHCAVGEVLDEQLRDEKRAEEHFTEALDIDPGYEPARQALEELYERQTNWEGLVDLYLDASERTDDLGEKATFLARIGDVYEQELDDRQAALDYYERALEEDPTVVDAAEPLAELYIDEDQIERAVPLLDRVIDEYEEAGDLDERELTDRHVGLAGLYEEIAHFEQALEHFERALDLDPENVDVLLGLGRVLYELGDFEAAAECYDALEQDFAAALETEELLDLYARSGHTHEELGEPDVALDYYERALELDGYNKPSLEALVDLHEELGNWEEVVEYNRRLIEVEEDNEIRFAKLTRNGEIFREEIGDLDRAVEAYSDALDLRPSSVAVLRELLQIYRSTDQWHAAVDILDRLIEQQDDPEREAYFCYTTGVLYRDKIGDGDTAIEYFDRALDANLQKLEAFEAIDRLLTDRKDWKELERAYRRMLHRVREHEGEVPDEIKFKLWEGLGEIYRSRLGHPKSAIKAFETAAELRPESEKIRLILADLHEQVGEDTEGRIEQHRKLLENDPYRIESYEALFDAYYDQGAYDRAWCFAGALTYLEKANDRQREFYDRYLEGGLDRADRTMGEDAFDKLYYPDQDRRINAIMSVLNQGLRDLYADDIRRDWGFEPETDQMDLSSGTLFANLYQYVAETVDIVPVPKVYAKRDQALGLRNANVQPPSIVAGADVVQTRNERELTFRLGKLLGAMRREHYLASIGWPTEFLKMMFMAGMHVTNPDLGIGEQLGDQGQTIASEIVNMPSQMQMELRKHMTEYLKRGENPNLTVWKKHVEHTTNRLGLLLCGDLRRAAAVVKNDQSPISKATVKEKVRELLLFSISDEYHVLRRRLGLSIEE
ncbi:MAG: tetratricopeptide repeat protein [Bradymonadaceae bacterium]